LRKSPSSVSRASPSLEERGPPPPEDDTITSRLITIQTHSYYQTVAKERAYD